MSSYPPSIANSHMRLTMHVGTVTSIPLCYTVGIALGIALSGIGGFYLQHKVEHIFLVLSMTYPQETPPLVFGHS